MDNYTYFVHEMSSTEDKTAMLGILKKQVISGLDHGPIPASLHMALDFLIFMASYPNEGHIKMSSAYDEVVRRLSLHLYDYHTSVSASELTWPACCATCPECHPDDEQENDPGCDGEDWTDNDGGGNSDDEELFRVLQELYGLHQNPIADTGTMRPFPVFEHWAQWTAGDWGHFEQYRKKVMAAATYQFGTMCFATNALAAIKNSIGTLPLDRQVEIAIWASDVVDCLTTTLETELFEICRSNLYTRRGRLVQKQLLSASHESDLNSDSEG